MSEETAKKVDRILIGMMLLLLGVMIALTNMRIALSNAEIQQIRWAVEQYQAGF